MPPELFFAGSALTALPVDWGMVVSQAAHVKVLLLFSRLAGNRLLLVCSNDDAKNEIVTDCLDLRPVVSGSLLGQFFCQVAARYSAKLMSGRDDGEAQVMSQ